MPSKKFYRTAIIPFIWRIFANVSIEPITFDSMSERNISEETLMVNKIMLELNADRHLYAALLIFKNNILGCIINVSGGFLLGIGTIANLFINGIMNSDMFCTSYEMGLSVKNIFRTTLPHSYELLAFWQSGALGLIISYRLLLSMFGGQTFDKSLLKYILLQFSIVCLLILIAAFVESYISSANFVFSYEKYN